MLRRRSSQSNSISFAVNVLKGKETFSPFLDEKEKKLKRRNSMNTPPANKFVVTVASLLSFGVIAIVFIFMSWSSFRTRSVPVESSTELTDVLSTVDSLITAYQTSVENIHSSVDLSTQFAEYDSILESAINKHCMSQLSFEIENKNLFWNSLFAHVDLWINSLAHNTLVEDLNPKSTVVTNQGTIIDISHSDHSTDFKATEYASCDLVQVLIAKSREMHLVSGSQKYVDEFGIDSDEYWKKSVGDANKVNQYFANSDVNKDALRLIKHASNNKMFDMEMELPEILKHHCGHVLDSFQNKNDFKASHNFVNQMTHMLQLLTDSVTIDAGTEEIPIVDKDGKLYFIHREELLHSHNDYMQCELLEKVVYFGQSKNTITDQTDALLNDIKQKTDPQNSHDIRLSAAYAFDSRSDIFLEQHCPTVMSSLHKSNGMFGFKGNFLTFVENVVSGDHLVGNNDDWIVTNDGSILHRDIALEQGHRDIMECTLIKYISSKGEHGQNFDDKHEHMFDSSFIFNKDFEDELIDISAHRYSNQKQSEYQYDATVLYQHIINREHSRFMVAIERMMNYYHAKDLTKMTKVTVERLFSDIQDILEIVAESGNMLEFVEGKTESAFSEQTGTWSVSEDNDFSVHNGEIVSPFLNGLLKYFIEQHKLHKQQTTSKTSQTSYIENLVSLVESGDYYESSMKLEKLLNQKCEPTFKEFVSSEQTESFYDKSAHLLYHVATHLAVPTVGTLTIENQELVYTTDASKTTSCSVINDIFAYGVQQNTKLQQTTSAKTIENDVAFFKQSFEISSPTESNQHTQTYETKSDSDIKQYVKLLKEDAKKEKNIDQVKKDIIEDLHYFCNNVLEHLSSRTQRRLRAHTLDLVEKGDITIANAVITSNGLIQSSSDVDSNDQFWKCEFITELFH